jgi:predicted O-methyltransferase YrrM
VTSVSLSLRRARLILAEAGPMELVRRGLRELTGLPVAYRELGRVRTFESSDELVAYVSGIGGNVVAPLQIRSEVAGLLDRVKALEPKVVLEIGTANGGSLLLFARTAHPQATLISIDLGPRAFRHGYAVWRIPLYRRFASPGQTLHLLRADSHDPATRARVKELLGDRSVDFLFIDGDHSDAGVRADWELFHDLVRPVGLIALHDIVPSGGSEVHLLWNELKAHYRHEELIADPNQRWCGIGLVHVD